MRLSVFRISLIICLLVAVLGCVSPLLLKNLVSTVTLTSMRAFDSFYLITCSAFIFLALFLALSPYGRFVLGKPGEKPEYSRFSWLAMLFASGMGSGLLFWGVAEPLTHYFEPPFFMPEEKSLHVRWALLVSHLHWGIHAWSIYAIVGLSLAYFSFRKNTTLLASGPIHHFFKGKTGRTLGGIADVTSVLAVVFGVLGTLGMGTLQMTTGLGRTLGTAPDSLAVSIVVLFCLTGCFILSASTGIGKGIRVLSQINVVVALMLMLFVLVFGPTSFIFSQFFEGLFAYSRHILPLSLHTLPFADDRSWSHSWTVQIFIWWIAWAPFVGVFIARISRGRTLREFLCGVILIPSFFSLIWFSIFGGAGLYQALFEGGSLQDQITGDVTQALFALLASFPFAQTLSILAVFLMFIFLITSADSACFVLGMMTSHGDPNPPLRRKIMWGLVMMSIVLATLLSRGGTDALKSITILGALPFLVVILFNTGCLIQSLRRA